MPSHHRNPSGLSDIDEADSPFSSLFDGSFDQSSVEATAEMADNSIFVTSSGSRFRLQRIPEPNGSRSSPATPPSTSHHQDAVAAGLGPTPSLRQAMSMLVAAGEGNRPVSGHRRNTSQEPKVPTDDVANMMGHLNIGRFGASALYGQSDGGVHAAETLTNRMAPPVPMPVQHPAPEDLWCSPVSIGPPPINYYPGESKGHLNNVQTSGVRDAPPTNPPLHHSLSTSTTSSLPSLPSLMEYSSLSPASSQFPLYPHSPADMSLKIEVTREIDTQTPVVVAVHHPASYHHLNHKPAGALSFDATSTTTAGRDNVMPGEDVVWDGPVQTCPSASPAGSFDEAHLKVFRNTLSNDLRFHCRVGAASETHWIKGAHAQLVPLYAYDARAPLVVSVRDTAAAANHYGYGPQGRGSGGGGGGGPLGVYRFEQLQDLFRFQGGLTGEDVVLDISSVKWVKLTRANTRSSEMYSGVRLQIWHEPRSRKGQQSDAASFVTAGTTLSGPVRDRVVPTSARLLVFLGRAEEYVTSFVTDDVEIELKTGTSVRLKPRKYGGFQRRSSRPGVKARLEPRSAAEPAGLPIHGQVYNPDVEASFDVYKTFEIEFESSPSQVNFVQAWKEIMDERRKQRSRLAKIQEDMRKEAFTGRTALSIRM